MKLDFSPPAKRALRVLQPYTGTGKSFAAADHLAEVAAYPRQDNGKPLLKVTYAAPSHVVGLDMERALASRGVPEEAIVHRWSVLLARTRADGTVVAPCARKEEIEALVNEAGLQPRKVCVRCPLRDDCSAYAAAVADDVKSKTAAIEIVAHAGLSLNSDSDSLICDEPPSYLETISISSEVLAWIRKDTPIPGALSLERDAARLIARAWHTGRRVQGFRVGVEREDDEGNPVERETVEQWLAHRNGSAFDVINGESLPEKPGPDLLAVLRGLRNVLRLAAWDQRQDHRRRKSLVVEAAVPTAAIVRLQQQGGVLLDATPWTAGLAALFEDLTVVPGQQPDWPNLPVTREWRESNAVSKTRLCHSYWSPLTRRFADEKRCREVDGVSIPGINWPLIENELRLSLVLTPGALLLGTFKLVRDVLAGVTKDHVEREGIVAEELPRLQALGRVRELIASRGVEICSFGAVRSRNDWQDVRQVLVIGSPFMGSRMTAEALGLDEDDAERAQIEYAKGELIQTAERGRSVRRGVETPLTLTLVCAEKCRPEGWGGAATYLNGGVVPLDKSERALRSKRWLAAAIEKHGDLAVKAEFCPTLGARQWRRWKSEDDSVEGAVSFDGRLLELLGVDPLSQTTADRQFHWRRILDELSGVRGLPEDLRRKCSRYRVRGKTWLIPDDFGLLLESTYMSVLPKAVVSPIRTAKLNGDTTGIGSRFDEDLLDDLDGPIQLPGLPTHAPEKDDLMPTKKQQKDELRVAQSTPIAGRAADDISFTQAVSPSTKRTDVLRAMRTAIQPQCDAYRAKHNVPSTHHVDHVRPLVDLAAAFLTKVETVWDDVDTRSGDGDIGQVLTNPLFERAWQAWHRAYAELQALPARENLRKGAR